MISLRPIVCSVHPDFPTALTGERPSGYFDCYDWTLDFLNWRHANLYCQSLQNRVQTISTVWGVFFLFISVSELCPWSYWDVFSMKAIRLCVNYHKSSCKLSLYENVIGKKKNTWGQTNNSEDNFNSAAWKLINPPLLLQHNTVCMCAATLGGLLKMNGCQATPNSSSSYNSMDSQSCNVVRLAGSLQ